MKGIPGTDSKLLNELGRYVDRVSVNIELPSEKALRLLAPQKITGCDHGTHEVLSGSNY